MPRKFNGPHERLEVSEPCTAEWDSMEGGDRVRFCAHCRKHVHNLSEFTPREAAELALRSGGRLCLRIERRPGGRPLTKTFKEPLYQIRRRVSRLAAGAFGAAVTLCAPVAAHAQATTQPVTQGEARRDARDAQQRDEAKGGARGSIVGTVTDEQGAVIPGALVTLASEEPGLLLSAVTDGEGVYRFDGVGPGAFNLKFEREGFAATGNSRVAVGAGEEVRADATLRVDGGLMVMGIVVVSVEPEHPLVKAAYHDDLEAVKKILLFDDADINVVDKAVQLTALSQAVSNGNREIVRELLSRGANVNKRSAYRQTALMRLGDRTTAEIIRDLIDAGAKVNLKDEDGNTALINAAERGKTEIVEALLRAGAKPNARNSYGTTALMLAAGSGLTEMMRALINAGADVNQRDEDGDSALTRAKAGEHAAAVDLLIAYGATPDEQ